MRPARAIAGGITFMSMTDRDMALLSITFTNRYRPYQRQMQLGLMLRAGERTEVNVKMGDLYLLV